MNTDATVELLLEAVFSNRSVERGYKEDNQGHTSQLSFLFTPSYTEVFQTASSLEVFRLKFGENNL
jgi:hypothetical protein